jgi:xylulokinase
VHPAGVMHCRSDLTWRGISLVNQPRLERRWGQLRQPLPHKPDLRLTRPSVWGRLTKPAASWVWGSIAPGMATVTLGTAGFTIVVVDTPTTGLGGLLTNHHAVSDLWQVEGVSLAAASSYRWFRDTIGTLEIEREKQQGGNAFNALNDLAAQTPPGSRGVLFLPYLGSAGTPRWNPHARAAFIGLSMAHGRAELARAVMEGVTLEMHDMMTGWYDNGMTVNTLRLGGGATHSPLWNHIQADVYGHTVQIMRIEESTALGAAILGGVGAGVFNSIQEGVDAMVHVASEIEPNMAHHQLYEEMYRAYIEAYEGLDHQAFGTLAAMQINS